MTRTFSKTIWTALLAAIMVTAIAAVAPAAPSVGDDVYTNNPIARVAHDAMPAVVNIDIEAMVQQSSSPFGNMEQFGGFGPFGGGIFRDFFEEFERYNRIVPMHGRGSGFIVDKRGYIITNCHVVTEERTGKPVDKITVTLMDGRKLDAELIGRDPTFDLAVVKVEATDLPTLKLGDSDKANIGEWVTAIGNPHGFEHTVTAGIISGKNRTLQASDVNLQGIMQTDAAINPGNSGGPLLNLDGEVVGINTAIVPYAQGIGFAVPVNMAKQILNDLIEHGSVRRGWLGIVLQTLTPELAEVYGITEKEGAIVSDVNQGSPAERAGLRRGDVITEINGEKVKNSQDVVLKIKSKLAGEKVKISLYRDGRKVELNADLGDIPESAADRRAEKPKDGSDKKQQSATRMGIRVSELNRELREKFRIKDNVRGVAVVGVDRNSPIARIGVKTGDVIVEVNRKRVQSVSDWERAMSDDMKTVVLLIWRDGQTIFLTYKNQN